MCIPSPEVGYNRLINPCDSFVVVQLMNGIVHTSRALKQVILHTVVQVVLLG